MSNSMVSRFPKWIRRSWSAPDGVIATRGVLEDLRLHTVCRSARCPNRSECWQRRTATFMILGGQCTRNCSFCAVAHGRPENVEEDEPARIAEAVKRLELRHVVVTSVTRDDLPDGGAYHFAATVEAIRGGCPGVRIEVLTPDFQGREQAIRTVLASGPDVFGHNIETVARLHPAVRDARCSYERSLAVLHLVADEAPGIIVKSSLMAGLGETDMEIRQTLRDLRVAGCGAVCIGQYLQSGPRQRPVEQFVPLEAFKRYETWAYAMGFSFVAAGPFVRSSYHADQVWTSHGSTEKSTAAAGKF
ncbi:MAG TPA: lipoyl synthase [Candidatus Hydrogenedentes bacterium]|nr:lipoyl synthase [Candidatus Hydrogenedentota bacterium]HPC15370.1 lipoyl synthase [Candidatus Hydrogenedentota bacterium]HRT19325.1 lipoyl synthase [Candidatus Hydrogenedentota bacterium]HRT63405.1 lipoyl synthase [Candidatus Hydrogenedentota bacterium]